MPSRHPSAATSFTTNVVAVGTYIQDPPRGSYAHSAAHHITPLSTLPKPRRHVTHTVGNSATSWIGTFLRLHTLIIRRRVRVAVYSPPATSVWFSPAKKTQNITWHSAPVLPPPASYSSSSRYNTFATLQQYGELTELPVRQISSPSSPVKHTPQCLELGYSPPLPPPPPPPPLGPIATYRHPPQQPPLLKTKRYYCCSTRNVRD